MTQLTQLDAPEIDNWLSRVSTTIDRSLREPARSTALAFLAGGGSPKTSLLVLAQLALLADGLRVAHLALEADGVIEDDELRRVSELVRSAATTYSAVLPQYAAFKKIGTRGDVERFLRAHRADSGPFGFASKENWRGLDLARRVEQHTRNASPLRDHERMLARIMDEVFGGRATDVERSARRRLRDLFEPPAVAGEDPRAVAFCRDDGPEVFASVAHGSQIHQRDPYDVEAIHAEARESFHRLVDRATTPEHHQTGHGRTLLVLGDSGCGKTHLLRALRAQVHGQRAGYVGYLQMTSEVGDYTRYVLRSLVDSLERPYDTPTLEESALLYLSDGLVEGRVVIPPDELERLRTAELDADGLDAAIGAVIDRVLRTEGLENLEVDLLHALLLLQRRDPAIQRRVIRFLRCEPLTAYDRKLLGGLSAREQPEDPLRTLVQLARIAHELQLAALIFVVDQIEETIPDGVTVTRLQQAFDSLRAVADAIPSAVIVISCLDDVYAAVRSKLSRSLVDRLEHDPAPVRLTSQRQPDEIEQMLARRLEHLFTFFDVPWREDEPTYPFTEEQIAAVSKFRARDCLAKFREYHAACIAARTLLPVTVPSPAVSPTAAPATPAPATPTDVSPVAPPAPLSFPDIDRAWNDELVGDVAVPDDDDDLLMLVEEAIRGAAHELTLNLSLRRERSGTQRALIVDGKTPRHLALCNRQAQGGHLGKQLEALKDLAKKGTIAVALRNSDFQFRTGTRISQQVGELRQAGGVPVVLEERELRTIVALRKLAAKNLPSYALWLRERRPFSRLGFVREALSLDVAPATAPVRATVPPAPPSTTATPPAPTPPTPSVPAARTSAPIPTFDSTKVRLGVSTTLRAEPQSIALEQLKTHVAFLGSTGSGKTTAALHVLEQALERGISVLLLDRKGDLARYASDAWWRDPTHDNFDRKVALRDRIDVALFTPGNTQGRPLRLPLIPAMSEATRDEREQLALFAASGLAAMMGYGASTTHGHKRSVLQCAIQLHANERDITLEGLLDTIERPDPDLLRSVGSLQRHFAGLSEDLQSLRIQRSALLSGAGESLDVASLYPTSGRARLTIINTAALTDVSVLQFWVSRLLVDLARLSRKRPSPTLQGLAFFDEADAYIPATSSPPTKDPMFDLLRRARSGGLGILLATQNPGDFDYRARDNIGTWLVGKVAQDRAIEKMKNLLGSYPNVASRLANQSTGQFFVLSNGRAAEVRCDRALMQTDQVSEAEVAQIARTTLPSA